MKRLVVCCDGTWNTPDQLREDKICPTNVVKTALAVAPQDDRGVVQLIFYEAGVGSGVRDRFRGGAFGWGLSHKILSAYRFLAEHYADGDEIYLFGFSRGAYTVRSLAGLIRNCGLLKREHLEKAAEANALYRRRDSQSHPSAVAAQLFRQMYAREVRIAFLGVWDTVGALGIPSAPWLPGRLSRWLNRRWEFHDPTLSRIVDRAYHAVAVDEQRIQYTPTLWEQQLEAKRAGQRMEQVWFVGVHSNIGGGCPDSGLSDIALLWMIGKAEERGLAFNPDGLMGSYRPDPLGTLVDSRTGIFRLWPPARRQIGGRPNANEAVHQSVRQRLDQARNPLYQPTNLTAFLGGTGPVRGIPAAAREGV